MILSHSAPTSKYPKNGATRSNRYTARILATLLMLGLALTCWYDFFLSGLAGALSGSGMVDDYGDWVGAAGTITFIAIISGWFALRSSAILRTTIFLIWFISTLFLTMYAITLYEVSFDSMAQINELLSVWLTKYMLFFVPGLLFVGATASFAWMLICGRPVKNKKY